MYLDIYHRHGKQRNVSERNRSARASTAGQRGDGRRQNKGQTEQHSRRDVYKRQIHAVDGGILILVEQIFSINAGADVHDNRAVSYTHLDVYKRQAQ